MSGLVFDAMRFILDYIIIPSARGTYHALFDAPKIQNEKERNINREELADEYIDILSRQDARVYEVFPSVRNGRTLTRYVILEKHDNGYRKPTAPPPPKITNESEVTHF
jgi:hypothetical protein